MKAIHRPFLFCSLAFVAVGTLMGFLMLPFLSHWNIAPHWWLGDARCWSERLQAHGQMQILGFCVLFTMGIAYQMLGELLNARQYLKTLAISLLLMVTGTSGQAFAPAPLWSWLQLLSGLIYVAGLTRYRAPVITFPRKGAHSYFIWAGSLWLLLALIFQVQRHAAAQVYEIVLWGFLSLYIMGVGLRVHPGMLARSAPGTKTQWTVWSLWNLGLVLNLCTYPLVGASCTLLAALVLVISLRPWRFGPNHYGWPLRAYLSWSYAWLIVACSGRLIIALPDGPQHWAGAVKHAHASGFVLTMMIGMGLRLIPSFERKNLAWPPARWLCLYLLGAGGILRVTGQALQLTWALIPGGTLQLLAIWIFVIVQLATIIFSPQLPLKTGGSPGKVTPKLYNQH